MAVEDDTGEFVEALQRLRELLKQEPDLQVRMDDNFLLRFIRSNDGDADKAMAKIKAYYQLKLEYPEWYASQPPIAYKELLEMACDYVLEDRDPSGKRVWVNKPSKVDVSKSSLEKQAQMHDLILETVLDEPETQKHGMAVICDMKDIPWALMRWLSPANLRISAKKADSLPFPRLEYHVVNASFLFNIIYKMCYPFLSAKQKEAIYIHGDNWESLHEKLDPSILPEEYGGKKATPSVEKLHTQIYDYTDKLMVNLNLGYKTSKEEKD